MFKSDFVQVSKTKVTSDCDGWTLHSNRPKFFKVENLSSGWVSFNFCEQSGSCTI